jgi:probable phosphoglycerate mutase
MVEPRLLERDYGAWTGRLLGDLDSPEEGTSAPGWDHRPPSGESSAEVVRRARAWLDELAEGPGPETWIAVTHKGVIRTLIAAAVRWDLCAPEPFRLLPERLHRIRRRGDGLLQLVTLNEPLVDTLEIEPAPAPKPSSPPQ